MSKPKDVIHILNEHLTAELTIINQYFLNSKVLENWGLVGLAKVFRDLSMEEMNDAERLIDRILLLEAHPNLQRLDPVRSGETAKEMIELALECEEAAITRLKGGVALATDAGDHGSRDLLAGMLAEEERHADYFRAQLTSIGLVGLENYLAAHLLREGE